jgi:hypothetical protein
MSEMQYHTTYYAVHLMSEMQYHTTYYAIHLMLETLYTTTAWQFRNKSKFPIVQRFLTKVNLSVPIGPDSICVFKYTNNFEWPVSYFSEQIKVLPFM